MSTWATSIFVPTLALIITNCMWLSPLKHVQDCRLKRDIGDSNPMPYVITVFNCIGWTVYGLILKDHFVFWSNSTGLVLGLYYTINSLTLLAAKTKPFEPLNDLYCTLESLLLFAFGFWLVIFLVAVSAFNQFSDPQYQALQLIGNLSMAFAIGYYLAPLYTMFEVVQKRDSSSLYGPTLVINLINSSLWGIYGLAQQDFNLYFPNLFGVPLTVLQLVLLVMFHKKSSVVKCFWDWDGVAAPPGINNSNGLARNKSVSIASDGSVSGTAAGVAPTHSPFFDDYMDAEPMDNHYHR